MRLLLVEDDSMLGEAILIGLRDNGYTVDWIQDGMSAIHAIKVEYFDTIILDIGLPKKNGLEVLKELRSLKIDTPVIILTARDTIEDRVNGLDFGADDYLTKPFELKELCARIRACQRRRSGKVDSVIKLGCVVLDTSSHKLKINDITTQISRREYSILIKLMESSGKVISREILSQSVYGWSDDVDSNAIEVHIHNLRKKLKPYLNIKTIRGIGYIIEEEEA